MISWIFENNKLTKSSNEDDLLKQSIYNMLTITVGDFEIYSYNYGNQALNFLTSEPDILIAKMEEFINNALLIDDRISKITNLSCSKNADSFLVVFDVIKNDGNSIYIESEVSI